MAENTLDQPPAPLTHHEKVLLRQKRRDLLLERIENAIRGGIIDLHDDWEPTSEIAITGGELALLLKILFPTDYRIPPLPSAPTQTAPGTAARVAVMADRIARGQSAFHPLDATPTPENDLDLAIHYNRNLQGVTVTGWGNRGPK